MKKFWIITLSIFCLVSTSLSQVDSALLRSQKQFHSAVNTKLKLLKQINPQGKWGLQVYSLTHKKVLYALSDTNLFMPASNQKIITSAAALHYLGTDFAFKTPLLTDGYIQDSILYGNVVIVGSGDPSFSGRLYENNPYAVFEEWAKILKTKGIKQIKGSVIADDRAYQVDFPKPDRHYPEDTHEWWNVQTSAFSFNDNQVTIKVTPGKLNKRPIIEVYPKTAHVLVQNLCTTTSKGRRIKVTREPNSYKFVVSGWIGQSYGTYEDDYSIENPTQFFIDALAQCWKKQGIAIHGHAFPAYQLADFSTQGMDTLYVHHSKNIFELLYPVNNNSNNMYAEAFFHKLGENQRGLGNFSNSMAYLRHFAQEIYQNAYFDLADGSGLSRCNAVSPALIIKVLEYVHQQPYFEQYLTTFSKPSVCGTAYKKLNSPYLNGKTYVKTGTLHDVEAFSGYFKSSKNEWIAFSFIGNHLARKHSSLPHAKAIVEAIGKYF